MNVMRSVPGPTRARRGGRTMRTREADSNIYGLVGGVFKPKRGSSLSTGIGSVRSSLLSEIRRHRDCSTESGGTSPSVSKILSSLLTENSAPKLSTPTGTEPTGSFRSEERCQFFQANELGEQQNLGSFGFLGDYSNEGEDVLFGPRGLFGGGTVDNQQLFAPAGDVQMQTPTNQAENPLFCLGRIAQDYGEPALQVTSPQCPPDQDAAADFVFKTPQPRAGSSTNRSAESILKTPSTANTLPRLSTPLFSSREPSLRRSNSSSTLPKKSSSSGRARTTLSEPSTVSSSTVFVAMTEGRGYAVGEVGLAFIDSRRHVLTLCQISDSQTYMKTLTKILIHNPSELIVPDTFVTDADKSDLLKRVTDNFKSIKVVALKRQLFNAEQGISDVRSLSLPECSSVDVVTVRKYYALSAMAALLKYAEHEYKIVFAKNSIHVNYESAEGIVAIDLSTSRRLELVAAHGNFVDPEKFSLLGVMNSTATLGGRRRLRLEILQPPAEQEIINERLDIVELLVNDSDLFASLKAAVAKFSEAEKLMWLCRQTPDFKREKKTNETITNYILLLKSSLENIPVLRNVLSETENDSLLKIRDILSDQRYRIMEKLISEKICDDAKPVRGCQAEIKRCFSIKEKVNGLLDVARDTYTKLITEVQEEISKAGNQHGLQLRMGQSAEFGYHGKFVIPKSTEIHSLELPAVFTDVKIRGNMCHVSTNDIYLLNNRIYKVVQELQLVSNAILYELVNDLRPSIGCLHNLCENIAFLDFICSLAQYSRSHNMVRPTFENNTDVCGGRHPILDCLNPLKPIPNDIIATTKKNFNIITGPNMGGKTIYLLQVALLQIMAQVGCYIPAVRATFRLTNHIFLRKEDFNDLANQASSFHVEVKELMHCLNSVTDSSLILMDEMFYGTSNEIATVVSWAICEQLLTTPAFTFLTTHLHNLTNLEKLFVNVNNFHMEAIEATGGQPSRFPPLTYTHRLLEGVTPIEHYGVRLMLATSLPEPLKQEAARLVDTIAEQRSNRWIIAKMVPSVIQQAMTQVDLLETFINDFYLLSKSPDCSVEKIKKLQQRAADTIIMQEIRSQILNEPGTPVPSRVHQSSVPDQSYGQSSSEVYS